MTKNHHPLAVASAIVGGGFMVLQAKANGLLGVAIGSGVLAAEISFGTGLLIIFLVMIFRKKTFSEIQNLVSSVRENRMPWWFLLAGSIGGFFVITQGITAGVLGISIFTLSVVTGQSIAAIIIDTFGLLGMKARRLHAPRAIGAALAALGLMAANYEPGASLSPLLLLPLFAGFGIGFQQAMNGTVGKSAESPLLATLVNFVIGTLFIGLVLITQLPEISQIAWPQNPLLYLGGLLGVVFIFAQVVIVRIIGILAMGISLLFGQLVTSFVLDLVIPTGHDPLKPISLLGIALVGLGAVLVIRKR